MSINQVNVMRQPERLAGRRNRIFSWAIAGLAILMPTSYRPHSISSQLYGLLPSNQEPEARGRSQERAKTRQQLSKLYALTRKLKPLHKPMGGVLPGDWLASHPEKGQSFRQYVNSKPIQKTAERNVLYILPLGDFTSHQKEVLKLCALYLSLSFSCEVKTLGDVKLHDVIPPKARRLHPTWGMAQIQSTYILEHVLPSRLPADGVALICLTASDLYPDDDWNFVFGQATLQNRVGVWSMYRHGDAETEFELCLRRTLKVATHETGHMFSMSHCIAYECNMCGTNSLAESDRRPLYRCPECEAKISFATNSDALERFENLLRFCQEQGLTEEAEYYRQASALLRPMSNSNNRSAEK
jgi:archaemetzincin